MKFEEFKDLVEKRKVLIEKKDNATNDDDRYEYDIQVEENDERIFGTYEFASSKLYKIFYVGAENVKNFLTKFFKAKDDKSEVNFTGFLLNLEVLAGDKYYMLGSFEKNQSLQCLYSKTNTDWERLMSDYPDLEEFLWNSFNEFKTVEKRKEMTLIQRKLDEENKELEFLTDVEKLYERISELKTRKKKYEAQIAEIKDLIETVPFD